VHDAQVLVATILAGIAAIIHVVIFALESVLWSKPTTWRRFGVRSQDDADVLRPMAYNQGFYNVFLAVGTAAAFVMLWTEEVAQSGLVLAIFTLSCMLLAAIVLVASNPRLVRAAVFQGAAPLLGLVFLVLAILVGGA
jgi:putative membrane protein